MAQAKKFGTFSGVFTPSILTILGVIMYMRLPWIVGNAGMWSTIGIVLVAHIISITTGLSVSSIATDKKVKAGGTYYMISRSLGLPIGGTLGLALAVGLAFSVSLYLIGFSESFLGYWEFEITKNNIRIAGSIALLLVTIVTFISTELALKSQFFILGAILLSLFSIFLGSHDLTPAEPLINSIPDAAPWMLMFGIFFPAVTGFEAGVSMSGDLEDPKKSIPSGSIAAIAVGLVVYIGLTIYFAFTVSSDDLINNPKVLLEIAFWPPAVIAGIWCATISSALGSILSSPRILQAAAADRIAPKFFAKGHGKSNEPRNALLMTFVIAEAGILVGELDIIARVVSMFFITTYGFLNMSCALENWASTDFRPEFRIPAWVSIIGSLACFIVMILLDFPAMVGATVVLGGLFLYLKRKELTLESGDTWEGVWSSVVRSGLQRLSQTVQHQRNWRPNIILFSGGNETRPHLVQFGEWLVRKRGILSNFELIENAGATSAIAKTKDTEPEPDAHIPGIFSRTLQCRNIYEGMEAVTQIYGFSGIDPNTVMLGWARNSRDPLRFAHLIRQFSELDNNILMLDYDAERGFGSKKTIDLWWRGGSNNATLALNMLKFLRTSEDWEYAQTRILTVVDNSALVARVQKNLNRILDDERIEAEVKIINNAVEKRPFVEIVKRESGEADLSMIGLPPITDQNAASFIEQTDSIISELGSVLLIGASSYFETLYVGIETEKSTAAPQEIAGEWPALIEQLPALNLPEQFRHSEASHETVRKTVVSISDDSQSTLHDFYSQTLLELQSGSTQLVAQLQNLTERSFDILKKQLPQLGSARYQKLLSRVQTDVYFHTRQSVQQYREQSVTTQKDVLNTGLDQLQKRMDELVQTLPDNFAVFYEIDQLQPQPQDHFSLRWFKFRKRLKYRFGKSPISVQLDLRKLWQFQIATQFNNMLQQQFSAFGVEHYELISAVTKWFNHIRDSLGDIQQHAKNNDLTAEVIDSERQKLDQQLADINREMANGNAQIMLQLLRSTAEMRQSTIETAFRLESPRSFNHSLEIPKNAQETRENLNAIPEAWSQNMTLVCNFAVMELHLAALQNRLGVVTQKFREQLSLKMENTALDQLQSVADGLESLSTAGENGDTKNMAKLAASEFGSFGTAEMLNELRKDVQEAVQDLPENVDIISETSFQQIETQQFDGLEVVSVSLRQLAGYLVETRLVAPVEKQLEKLPATLRESQNVSSEVVRLVSFSLSEMEAVPEFEQEIGETITPLQNIIQTGLRRIAQEKESLLQFSQSLMDFIDQQRNATFEKLNPYVAVRDAGKIGQYIRAEESRKVLSGVDEGKQRVKNIINNTLVRLLYRRSEGVLLARKLWETGEQHSAAPVERLLSLVESVSPQPEILENLPLFYRQLFLAKQAIGNEFWVGRQKALAQASQILKRYQAGYSGAMLVLGERNSGKTALCRAVAANHFARKSVFQLFAPDAGSCDPAVFLRTLQETTHINETTPERVLEALPPDSAIIINDLELWWERGANGFAVIDELLRLINRFSKDCLFIVNANTHSYKFINRLKTIDESFIGVIFCEPFDAEDLQNAILLRHQSTGLEFVYDGEIESAISRLKMARLFNAYFDFSTGNIGAALLAWISHIEKAGKDRLTIRMPDNPGIDRMNNLKAEWAIWLTQFVLHKHLSNERLQRLFRSSRDDVSAMLRTLQRTGLLIENHGTWEINPHVEPFVVEKLQEMELL